MSFNVHYTSLRSLQASSRPWKPLVTDDDGTGKRSSITRCGINENTGSRLGTGSLRRYNSTSAIGDKNTQANGQKQRQQQTTLALGSTSSSASSSISYAGNVRDIQSFSRSDVPPRNAATSSSSTSSSTQSIQRRSFEILQQHQPPRIPHRSSKDQGIQPCEQLDLRGPFFSYSTNSTTFTQDFDDEPVCPSRNLSETNTDDATPHSISNKTLADGHNIKGLRPPITSRPSRISSFYSVLPHGSTSHDAITLKDAVNLHIPAGTAAKVIKRQASAETLLLQADDPVEVEKELRRNAVFDTMTRVDFTLLQAHQSSHVSIKQTHLYYLLSSCLCSPSFH
jgi:hypothetical protein